MKNISLMFVLAISSILFSCSKFGKQQRSSDPKTKYNEAVNYYNNKEYLKSGVLFQQILPVITGTPEGEKALYMYSYCHFHQGQYRSSLFNFRNFYDSYFRNEKAEEALYMVAMSQFNMTQPSNLDQSTTKSAISAFQEYINVYPSSTRVKEAEENIKKLRAKLEKKDFDNAFLFAKLERYKAAVISFSSFLEDYPDSEMFESAHYYRFKSQSELALVSVKRIKKDRIEQAIKYYQEYVDTFKGGEYTGKSENIYKSLIKELSLLEKKEKEANL